jgi:hypothetical protein
LQSYSQPGPLRSKKGFLCGLFQEYLAVVAADKNVSIALVGHRLNNPDALKRALKENPALKSVKGRMEIKTFNDGFLITWHGLMKPKPLAVRAALEGMTNTAKEFMAPHAGRCQKCDQANTEQLVILGTMPKIVCDTCLSKLPEQKLIAEQEYEQMQPRSMRGFAYLLATITALIVVYGTVIGVVGRDGSYGVKLDAIIGLAFGAFCMMAFQAGAGKMTRPGMIASGIAGAAGKWICSTIFFTSMFVNRDHIPFSPGLVVGVATHLPQLAKYLFGGTILFYIAVALPLWFLFSPIPPKKFPQFEFVRLGKVSAPVVREQLRMEQGVLV